MCIFVGEAWLLSLLCYLGTSSLTLVVCRHFACAGVVSSYILYLYLRLLSLLRWQLFLSIEAPHLLGSNPKNLYRFRLKCVRPLVRILPGSRLKTMFTNDVFIRLGHGSRWSLAATHNEFDVCLLCGQYPMPGHPWGCDTCRPILRSNLHAINVRVTRSNGESVYQDLPIVRGSLPVRDIKEGFGVEIGALRRGHVGLNLLDMDPIVLMAQIPVDLPVGVLGMHCMVIYQGSREDRVKFH